MSVCVRRVGTVLGIVAWCSAAAWAEPVLWPVNGHYYDVVDSAMTWDQAFAAASSLSWLATVTSADENLFLTNTFNAWTLDGHWLGGYQLPGSPEPAVGWTWVTGEPFNFLGWSPGEPNDYNGIDEDRLCFLHPVESWGKPWNDQEGSTVLRGYVVEFPVPEPNAGLLLALPLLMARRQR